MNSSRSHSLIQSIAHRRGNTIVLVIGVLVLFVIIATAYVTRTQSGRGTATSVQRQNQRDDNLKVLARDLAEEIAGSLFVRPIDACASPGWAEALSGEIVSSNRPRLPAAANAVRYGLDFQFDPCGTGNKIFPYNNAAYHLAAWTNWPDSIGVPDPLWPNGTGNFGGGTGSIYLNGEDNPFGNPGFGDTRWLRDLEPLRWDSWFFDCLDINELDGNLDAYSHWRHLTMLARPDNGLRVVYNIADIEASLVTDLGIPIEQWLAIPLLRCRFGSTGDPIYPGQSDFEIQWANWFGSLGSHQSIYSLPTAPNIIPHNHYRLSDLNANGSPHELGERPEDEFIEGTARWSVSRVLADTDGDGYTDALWHLVPTSVQSGIRQIVAVSIIDNCSMIDANVASRFMRNDSVALGVKTNGLAPSDLALVGQLSDTILSSNFNVGYYDNPLHHYYSPPVIPGLLEFDYDVTLAGAAADPRPWQRHSLELGLPSPTFPQAAIPSTLQRLDFWRRAASSPFSVDSSSPYTPFTLADEIELRMYFGQNYPWIFTRYEHTVQDLAPIAPFGDMIFLRAGTTHEESSEFLGKTSNRLSLRDPRHRITLFSGARNDLIPPWLMANPNDPDPAAHRKLDLRSPYFDPFVDLTQPADVLQAQALTRLRNRIQDCLIDPQNNLPGDPGTYFGIGPVNTDKTRRLAAAFAANIWARRDNDTNALLTDSVPVPPNPNSPSANESRFLGIEAQPFLLEVFIGHVYKAITVPPADLEGDLYLDAGDYLLLDPSIPNQARRSTVVAVQIANPFDVPVDLTQYQIVVAGQPFDLGTAVVRDDLTGTFSAAATVLQPGTPEKPTTAIYYSIDPSLIGLNPLDLKWKKFLDLIAADHPSDSIIATSNSLLTPGWSNDREPYDQGPCEVTLARRDPVSLVWVVVDRMDSNPSDPESFASRVQEMGDPDNRPRPEPDPLNSADVPPTGDNWYHPDGYPANEIKLGPAALGYEHWVQWVRGTRAWGIDLNGNGWYDFNERNPRFVIGERAVIDTPGGPPVGNSPQLDGTTSMGPGKGGNRYKFARDPDSDPVSLPIPNLPWFTRKYVRADGSLNPEPSIAAAFPPRKPTFFEMNAARDPAAGSCTHPYYPFGYSYPDKGWYGQKDVGAQAEDPGSVDVAPTFGGTTGTSRLGFPMQMLQKDDDFEQLGELLNVWLFCHELEFAAGVFTGNTIRTFSEYMTDQLAQGDVRVNRLRTTPVTVGTEEIGAIIGVGDIANLSDPRHSVPAMPAGARIFDAFVCDGVGYNFDPSLPIGPGNWGALMNAKGFDGTATPGMINASTAPPEVLRSNPHWYRAVHETGLTSQIPATNGCMQYGPADMQNYAGQFLVTDGSNPDAMLPRSMVPEAILHYREQFNGGYDPHASGTPSPVPTGIIQGSNYESRRDLFTRTTPTDWTKWIRGDRGFASVGELMLLTQSGQSTTGYVDHATAGAAIDRIYNQYWSIDLGVPPAFNDPAPAKPFWGFDPVTTEPYQESLALSTDVVMAYDPFTSNATTTNLRPDSTAGDAEEANALFAGASNIVTTRSDMFTVYFKVRSFRQNTSVSPPRWDATNPEYIVDDSRYVMLVDRSNVNKPGDKPRILYLEKLPN